ncbi:MAG: hypothetical protein IJX88_03320 [Clostridia bacterium]|nr:hypothetical protein [Clostridia bacterium]
MENFSVLKFLQSLLTQPPQAQADASPPEPVSETEMPPSATEEQTNETPNASQDAFLRFMEEHERRAKRTKR